MFRTLLTICIVLSLLLTAAAPTSAESRSLYLPAVGRVLTEYATIHGHAICQSGRVPGGQPLTISRWYGIINYDTSVDLIAAVGTVAPILYWGEQVHSSIWVYSGWMDVGLMVLPC